MSAATAVVKRLALTAVVALVVVGLVGVVPLLATPDRGISAGPDHPEYAPARIAPDRLESDGAADPEGDVGVVLFDRAHNNRFEREDVAALTRAINQAGGDVRFTRTTGSLTGRLEEADVLVVVDPASDFTENEVEAIQTFVDNGGRLLVVGEPNRKELQQGVFTASLVTKRSHVTELASAFSISYGTQYLYDLETNDGNFKAVAASPPGGTDHPAVEGVDTVTMYTAASVEVNRGTVLLRTAPTARRGSDRASQGFPVAVVRPDDSVMAVGDKTFLSEEFHAVADNDVFIQRMVEFMTEADHQPSPEAPGNQSTEAPPRPAVARAPS